MQVVIMAGGCGVRMWPISNYLNQKSFLKLSNGLSMLENTIARMDKVGVEGFVISTCAKDAHRVKRSYNDLVEKKLIKCRNVNFVFESISRNTLASVLVSCLFISKKYSYDELVLFGPVDSIIINEELFFQSVESAKKIANNGKIAVFGVKSDSPMLNYGYIEVLDDLSVTFKEKPSIETYSKLGPKKYQNTGIFCSKVGTVIDEIKKYEPDLFDFASNEIGNINLDAGEMFMNKDFMEKVKNISIDYTIMEKSKILSIVDVTNVGWVDIGDWMAIYKASQNGIQAIEDKNEKDIKNCHGSYFYTSKKGKKIVAIDVDDSFVVDSELGLLVCAKGSYHKIKDTCSEFFNQDTFSGFVAKPWGSYTVLIDNPNFKLKKIDVYPGARLSLQSHKHRSENWVVVEGVAEVTNGDHKFTIGVGESTFIPAGNKHRLSNPSDSLMLSIIEVQTGTYFGEDDIERFEDDYKRS